MRFAPLAFLCLILVSFLTIAQSGRKQVEFPWKFTIAGHTDSVSVDEILSAGKLECTNKAFEIIEFSISVGDHCLSKEGMYQEYNCSQAVLTAQARQLIRRLQPGYRLYIQNLRVRNKAGQELMLDSRKFIIRAKT